MQITNFIHSQQTSIYPNTPHPSSRIHSGVKISAQKKVFPKKKRKTNYIRNDGIQHRYFIFIFFTTKKKQNFNIGWYMYSIYMNMKEQVVYFWFEVDK